MAYAFGMRAGCAALAGLAVVLPHVVTAETHRSSLRGDRLMMPLGAEGPSNPILPSLREMTRTIEATRENQVPRRTDPVMRAGALKAATGLPAEDALRPASAVTAFPEIEMETRRPWPRLITREASPAPIMLSAVDAAPERAAARAGLPWAPPAVPALLSAPDARALPASVARLEMPPLRPRQLSAKGGALRLPLLAHRHRLNTRVAFATSQPGVPQMAVPARSTDPIGNPLEALGARVATGPAFIMPFENGRVTSLFNQGRRHPAIDLAGRMGAPVYATSHGQTVIFAGGRGGYGNAVITRDREGREHLYGHLSAINTRVGVTLAQGDRLGALGSTGYSTGPHVHYEVKDRRGAHINPVSLLFPRGVSAGYAWSGTGLVRGGTAQAALEPRPAGIAPVAAAAPAAVPPRILTSREARPALVRAQVSGLMTRANRGRARRQQVDLEE